MFLGFYSFVAWISELLDSHLFWSNVHERSSDNIGEWTFLLVPQIRDRSSNMLTRLHCELQSHLQLSSVVCLALPRLALQWIPPDTWHHDMKHQDEDLHLDLGLSLWSKLVRGSGTLPRNSSTPRKFRCNTVRTISAVFPLLGINLQKNLRIIKRKYFFSFLSYSSHCSIHSTESVIFSTTEVWNFSLPRPIVTKGSLVPFFPLIFRPLARFTATQMINIFYKL